MTKSPFKSEAGGPRYTQALFLEQSYNDRSKVLYTLRDTDHPDGYTSLYRKYLEMEDPTEIIFAREYLDGWEHFQTLCNLSWFKPYIARWREELDLQIRAKALQRILSVAGDKDSKFKFEANKFLLSGSWKQKDKVGRPSKEKIKAEANRLFSEQKSLDDDFQRINTTITQWSNN